MFVTFEKTKEYDNLILNKRYPIKTVKRNLKDSLNQFIEALHSKMNFPLMERNFSDKTKFSLDILKKNDYNIKLLKEEKHTDEVEIIETNHYVGI